MRVLGYCGSCHRVRQVSVSGSGLVRLAAGGAASGECADCEEEREERARASSRSRGRPEAR